MTNQASQQNLPVLVAGGGIGGLAAALALVNRGFKVKVLEQAPEIGEIGAGIQLGPNAFHAFDALEELLAADERRGAFCFGDAPTIADVYLVPQVESARRFKVDLEPYPRIVAIDRACAELDAFRRAAPAAQPDAR